jgi:hypothetical protein
LPLELRPAAGGIDILDPQQEKSIPIARGGPAEQGGMGMAQVKEAGRAGSEAGDGRHVGNVHGNQISIGWSGLCADKALCH